MGSYSTLFRQCVVLIAIFAVLVCAVSDAAKWEVAVAGLVALAFFLVISLVRHRQIKRLSAEIDEVLHNGRRVEFEKCREGDIAILANELEKMVACLARTTQQLEAERNALSDSLADISHQIRTPMTAAELMLASIERTEDPTERKRQIRELENMLERVSWLVTTLLKIAKVDAGAIHVESQLVKVQDAVNRAVAPLATSLDLRDITLEVDVASDVSFIGDEMWTAEALENILKNCMEHTPAGGTITIAALENTLGTSIYITDTGGGISEEDLPHIFERFYRGGMSTASAAYEGRSVSGTVKENRANDYADVSSKSVVDIDTSVDVKDDRGTFPVKRRSNSEGFGIGLALAQALVSAQGGTLRASNHSKGGAVGAHFQIHFFKLIV